MRTKGSPTELEHRRLLAVRRILEGSSAEQVAESLGVDPRSVRRWFARSRRDGEEGSLARPVAGRPPTLPTTQETIVLRRSSEKPTESGFAPELGTGRRLAQVIRPGLGIRLKPRSLGAWLRTRGLTPQEPRPVPRPRDPEASAAGLKTEGPRLKRRPGASAPTSP